MKAWAGLGYYSRARNLKAWADLVPSAAAVFPTPRLAERPARHWRLYVGGHHGDRLRPARRRRRRQCRTRHSRLFSITTPLSEAKAEIRAHVERMVAGASRATSPRRMMDLGRRSARRAGHAACCARYAKTAAPLCQAIRHFPVRLPKADKPLRRGAPSSPCAGDGAILCANGRKEACSRHDRGADDDWTARIDGATTEAAAPFPANWRPAGQIAHVFTHFALELDVFRAEVNGAAPAGHFWSLAHEISGEALPTVMKKAIEAAIPGATKKPSPHSAKRPMTEVRHIVFDIGRGADPLRSQHSVHRLIPDEKERKWFFDNVCTHDWNIEQDRAGLGRGGGTADCRASRSRGKHPQFPRYWHDMVPHAYDDSVAIMVGLIESGHDVTMLTNFATDTLAEARKRFDFWSGRAASQFPARSA